MRIPTHVSTITRTLEELNRVKYNTRKARVYVFEYDQHNPFPTGLYPIVGTSDSNRDWSVYAPGEYEIRGERERVLATLAQKPEFAAQPAREVALSAQEASLLSANKFLLWRMKDVTQNPITTVTLLARGENKTIAIVTAKSASRGIEHTAYIRENIPL